MGLIKWLEKKARERGHAPPESKGEPLVLKLGSEAYEKEQKKHREYLVSRAKEEAAKPRHQTLHRLGGGLESLLASSSQKGKQKGGKKGGRSMSGLERLGDISGRIGTGMNIMEKKMFSPEFATRGEISFGDLWGPAPRPKKRAGKEVHIYVHTEKERKRRRR